jgi:DNA-directed RNA polymerase subunit RPC12/RpoP
LKIQNKIPTNEYLCDSCDKNFLSSTKLRRHEKNCSSKDLVVNLNNRIKDLCNDIITLKKDNEIEIIGLKKRD